jgi:hypothetical protein
MHPDPILSLLSASPDASAMMTKSGPEGGAALDAFLNDLPREHIEAASRLGLSLKSGLNLENWSRLVAGVVQLTGRAGRGRDTLTAWLGDLLAFGGGKYRGQITEYAKAAGLDPGTLRSAKLVCSRIPLLCRHNTLWSIGGGRGCFGCCGLADGRGGRRFGRGSVWRGRFGRRGSRRSAWGAWSAPGL